jgi:hypothetical protein
LKKIASVSSALACSVAGSNSLGLIFSAMALGYFSSIEPVWGSHKSAIAFLVLVKSSIKLSNHFLSEAFGAYSVILRKFILNSEKVYLRGDLSQIVMNFI